MKPLVPILALAALAFAAPAAHAGYLAAGFGSDATLSGGLAQNFRTQGATDGRLVAGTRFGPAALELGLFGTDLRGNSALMGRGDNYTTLSLGADLKYYVPLFLHLEAYGKVGLHRTWLEAQAVTSKLHYSGRGYTFGGGLQVAFSLIPLAQTAVWLDYTHQVMSLHDASHPDLDGAADMVMIGVSVGTGL